MPTLYRYTKDSNSGTGYFVRAGVDGSVITLQTNRITEELYDELGYTAATIPEGGGDELPGRLVWSLHRVGLHHTEKQGVDTDREALLNSLQQGEVQLKSDEMSQLRRFIEKNLNRNEKLFDVAKDFGIDVEEGKETKSSEKDKDGKGEQLRKLYMKITQKGNNGGEEREKKPDLQEEVGAAIAEWDILTDPDEFMELISTNEELQESVRQMHNHNWKVESAQHEGDIILYNISPGSIRSGLPQVLEQWSETAHLVFSDFRASNEVNTPENDDVFLSEAHLDFSISVSLSESETDVCVFVENGHIMGDSLPNPSEVTEVAGKKNSRNFAAHKKLSYISFLYIVSEEFIESLDGYESANPYSEKLEGTVKFFHDRKGYGFIERENASESDESDDDVFFHMEDIGGPDLEEGEGVRFDVTEGEKGPRARDVERI